MSVANLDFSLRDYFMEGPILRFQAIGITSDYVPKEFIGQLAETARNKEIRFRHISPDDQVESYLGRIIDTKLQDGTMIITGEILGNTAEQQGVQQWIREQQAKGQPLGISMGFILTKDQQGHVIRVDAREASVTPSPKCGECRITKLLNEEKIGENRVMSTPTTIPTAQQQAPTPAVPASAPTPQPQVDPKITELERKLVVFMKENAALQEYIAEFSRAHDKALKELEQMRTLPIRNEIASLQKLEGTEYANEVAQLESKPITILTEIRDRLQKSRAGAMPAPRNQAIPASTILQVRPPDVENLSRDDKAKIATDFLHKYTKRSVN
jgi:hypothetical protein